VKTDLVQSARQQIDHIKTSTEPAAAKELSSEPLFAAAATPSNLTLWLTKGDLEARESPIEA
jgi:hypothetical protein